MTSCRRGVVVFLVAVLLGSVSCGDTGQQEVTGLRVGLVFDIGGRGDKSFNDSAYRGLERAAHDLGIHFEYLEPTEGSDREAGLREYASRGFDLVIGTGFMFSDDMEKTAREFPEVRFACVDYTVEFDDNGQPLPLPDNLVALKFREEEGSFLAGAVAISVSKTGKIGFVGGMDIPLIHKFEAGYRAGALHVDPAAEVLVRYAGVTASAFKDPAKGKELATSMYGMGADVIYHASGTTGFGVFEAAREFDRLAIGVDSDQYAEAPGYILTSMIKDVDVAVYDTIQQVQNGTFTGGIHEFGLAEDGVRIVRDANNRDLIPDAVWQRVEALRDSIAAGFIRVPRK
jgi:basic membrane protein A